MARWITVKPAAVPFDYRWPDASAITAFTKPGEEYVKDEIADYAVGKGFATEGKAKGSTTRSRKGKATRAAKPAIVAPDGAAPNLRSDPRLVRADPAVDGAAPAGGAVDPTPVER